jgi:flagellar basal-body rod modification protein FlgD
MSTVDPVSNSTGSSQPAGKSTIPDRSILGKDDFLKLFAVQLQHQDPMSPMDNMQFMSQMAQFSTLEQVTNLGAGIERLTFSNQVSQSVGLIGHTVDYVDASGQAAEGVAQNVKFADGTITVSIDGNDVSPDHITGVR